MADSPVVIVTGASSGIGEATARIFAQEGYRVILAARRLERLEILSYEIRKSGGEALPVQADLSQMEDIRTLVQTALDSWGRIDVLINNAGFGRMGWLEELDPIQDVEAQVNVNLVSVIQTTQVVLPTMINQRRGHIINMGSMAGLVATPTYSIYAATKYGIRGFSEALRREVGIYGIKVSVVYPGGVKTEFASHAKIQRKTGYTTPKSLQLEGKDVAMQVFGLVKKPRRGLIIPRLMAFSYWANFLFPGLIDRVIEKRFTIPERLN